jgi:hypothetical protein
MTLNLPKQMEDQMDEIRLSLDPGFPRMWEDCYKTRESQPAMSGDVQ